MARYTSSVGKDSKFYGIISSPKRDRPFPHRRGKFHKVTTQILSSPSKHSFPRPTRLSSTQHTAYDHAIDLREGATPLWGPIYALNETELAELRKWLKKMTDMGAVRPSKHSFSSPMLFVLTGHYRGLRLSIDYRGINKITIPNRYPLPNMDELKDRV